MDPSYSVAAAPGHQQSDPGLASAYSSSFSLVGETVYAVELETKRTQSLIFLTVYFRAGTQLGFRHATAVVMRAL